MLHTFNHVTSRFVVQSSTANAIFDEFSSEIRNEWSRSNAHGNAETLLRLCRDCHLLYGETETEISNESEKNEWNEAVIDAFIIYSPENNDDGYSVHSMHNGNTQTFYQIKNI